MNETKLVAVALKSATSNNKAFGQALVCEHGHFVNDLFVVTYFLTLYWTQGMSESKPGKTISTTRPGTWLRQQLLVY